MDDTNDSSLDVVTDMGDKRGHFSISAKHCHSLTDNLHKQQREGRFCDLKILIAGKIINVHRSVLVATCPYFSSMYSSNMVESKSNQVELHCASPSAIQKLVDFMYSGEIEISKDNVQDILKGADHLLLEEVKEFCSEFLFETLTPGNCLQMKQLADIYCLKGLSEKCVHFGQMNVEAVVKSDEILNVPFEALYNWLSDDHLHVENEEELFKLIVKWTKHKIEERHGHFPKLMAHIHLIQMEPQFVVETVEKEPLVKENSVCKDFLMEVMRHRFSPATNLPLSPRTCPRAGNLLDVIVVIGGKSPTYPITREPVMGYVIKENSWVRLFHLGTNTIPPHAANSNGSHAGVGHALQVLNNNTFVLGGGSRVFTNGLRSSVHKITIGDNVQFHRRWSKMKVARRHFALVLFEDKLYAIGGKDRQEGNLVSVESLDMSENESGLQDRRVSQPQEVLNTPQTPTTSESGWQEKRALNLPCSAPVTIVDPDNKVIYVLGGTVAGEGSNGLAYFKALQKYDIVQNTWKTCTLSPVRSKVSIVAELVNSKIHVYGDRINYTYIIDQDRWRSGTTVMPSMPIAVPCIPPEYRHQIYLPNGDRCTDYAQIIVGNYIYRFGGYQNGQVMRVAIRFSKLTQEWEMLQPPPIAFSEAQCCILKLPYTVLHSDHSTILIHSTHANTSN